MVDSSSRHRPLNFESSSYFLVIIVIDRGEAGVLNWEAKGGSSANMLKYFRMVHFILRLRAGGGLTQEAEIFSLELSKFGMACLSI